MRLKDMTRRHAIYAILTLMLSTIGIIFGMIGILHSPADTDRQTITMSLLFNLGGLALIVPSLVTTYVASVVLLFYEKTKAE